MEALIAKGDALKPVVLKSGRRKDKEFGKSGNVTRSKGEEKESDKKLDKTLHTLEHRLGLPASLKITPKSSVPSHKQIRDKKLRAQLVRQSEQKAISKEMIEELEDPLFALEDGGRIEVDGDMERTWRISQTEMAKTVDVESARMRREVKLDGGGYRTRYIRNGRHLAIVGRRGHAATFDALTGTVHSELQLKETCRDITFLQDTSFHAIAQKKYAFIYDKDGVEVHCLRSMLEPTRLEFLPYHWLLVSVGLNGHMHYLDTTTGTTVATHNTHLGQCNTMAQNSQNAVIHLGHSNGTVTLWTPNMSTPVVRVLSHLGSVTGLSVWGDDGIGGKWMATSGVDGTIKIWDARTFKAPMRQWKVRAAASTIGSIELDFSHRGHLAVASGNRVNIYTPPTLVSQSSNHIISPPLYLTHPLPSKSFAPISQPRFAPFFDVCSVGHGGGYSSILVPGSAESTFDSGEADPFESGRMRREREVKRLLDKIPSSLITLDPTIVGTVAAVDRSHNKVDPSNTPFARLPRSERLKISGKADLSAEQNSDDELGANEAVRDGPSAEEKKKKADTKAEREKNKMRGKNKSLKRYLRKKKKNVIDPATIALKEKIERQREIVKASNEKARKKAAGLVSDGSQGDAKKGALERFRR